MRILALVCAVGLVGSIRTAWADDATVWDRHFVVGGRADPLPFPFTLALVVFEVAPIPWASIEVGAGAAFAQYPAALEILHVQVPLKQWAPGVEIGVLMGPLTWSPGNQALGFAIGSDEIGYYYHEHLDNALFGRFGASLAFRTTSGRFQIRIHAGATGLLNRSSGYCVRDDVPGLEFAGCHFRGIPTALPLRLAVPRFSGIRVLRGWRRRLRGEVVG